MNKTAQTLLVDLDLSVRTLNTLKANNIETIGDLCNIKYDTIKSISSKTQQELTELLNEFGVKFKT
jgi:DNA-directed RNA polymerase alpha subunit